MNEKNQKTFDLLVDTINKKYGSGTMQSLAGKTLVDPESVISTGSISLDAALGIGGYKKGRIVEIFGPESCIHGNSFLQYEVWSKNERINHKGGTISRLYERFNKVKVDGTPLYKISQS